MVVLTESFKSALEGFGEEDPSPADGQVGPPLTAEPFLVEEAPLTSESPISVEPPLTSEPAVPGACPDPMEV